MEEIQLYSKPYCFFFIGNNVAQPHDPAFTILILTFGVRFGHPSSTAVVYYRRQFPEPLPVFTDPRHEPAARSKLSRMLDTVRVPHSRPGPGSDLVTEVLDGVRDVVVRGVEYPPPTTFSVVVKIDATVFHLPQTSEPGTERHYDGPPIYLDGPYTRDYDNDQPLDNDDGFYSSGLFNHPEDSYDDGDENFYEFEDEAHDLPEFFKYPQTHDFDFRWPEFFKQPEGSEDEAVDPYLLELFNYRRHYYDNYDNKDELNDEAVDLDHDNHDYGDDNADEFSGEVDHGRRRRQDFDFYWEKFYEFLRENCNNDEPNDESLDHNQDFDFYSSNLIDYPHDNYYDSNDISVDYHQNNYCDGVDNADEVNNGADDRDHGFDFYWEKLGEYNGVCYNHKDEI